MKNILFGLFILAVAGCANESDPLADQANFTRIYDNKKFNASYYPIDVKQTADGGYLILGGRRLTESNFNGIYLLKADAFGNLLYEEEVDDTYVNPVGLLENGGKYYFFCMTSVGLQTHLADVDGDGKIGSFIASGGSYPAAASVDGTNFILLSYNNLTKQSVLSLVSTTGTLARSKSFSIGAGAAVEEPVINHFLRTGRTLPFATGKAPNGLYYFNGFYNYTLSVVFTDFTAADPIGIIQGQQDDGGLSMLLPTTGDKFSAARFNFGDNYLLPAVSISTSGLSSSIDLGGNNLPELSPNAPVRALVVAIENAPTLLYASHTRRRQIALYGYNPGTGEFLGSRYLGFSNPFEVAAMAPTADGGLVVCGTTYVAGRFPRIALFKLSAQELAKSF